MSRQFTISATTENSPGILHRLTTVFTRRKINLDSLTVSETQEKGLSRFTIVVSTDTATVKKIVRQLRRIIEVRSAIAADNESLLFTEIALIRVQANEHGKHAEVEELADRFGATIIHVDEAGIVLQKSGKEDEIRSLYHLLNPLGVSEFLRSGRIAVLKDGAGLEKDFYFDDEPAAILPPSDV